MPPASISRRSLLAWLGGGALAPVLGSLGMGASHRAGAEEATGDAVPSGEQRLGLALGAGGAVGLAHIQVLEVLDELGVRPAVIAGSSIGALMGALYAGGMSGKEIRELTDELIPANGREWLETLQKRDWRDMLRMLQPSLSDVTLFDNGEVVAFLDEFLPQNRFDKLDMPLHLVAADFHTREQVVFNEGDLLRPLLASMALPGVFPPVSHNDRLLVDGGMVNPVPFDLLGEDSDIRIAVDVSGRRTGGEDDGPAWLDGIFNTFKIMQHAIVSEKRRHLEPDIFLSPAVEDVRMLEFYRSERIFRQAAPERDRLKRELEKLLGDGG